MKPARFWPLAALILLPLLVLAVIAAYGLKDRRAAVLAEASRQCKAGEVIQAWGRELDRVFDHVPVVVPYDDPPLPRAPGPEAMKLDAAIATGDIVALEALAGAKGEPAFTAAGLPVSVLAKWKLVELSGDRLDIESLGRMVTQDAPSAISAEIIHRLAARYPRDAKEYQWAGRWRRVEARQAALRQILPELATPGLRHRTISIADISPEVIEEVDDTYYSPKREPAPVRSGPRTVPGSPVLIRIFQGNDARVLLEGELRDALQRFRERMRSQLPPWAVINVSAQGIQLGDAGLNVFGGGDQYGCHVEVGAHSLEPILEDYRRMVAWAQGIIGTALITSVLGLWLVHRTLTKERRLGELKSQFVSSVSHELRAPVGSLRLMADGLASGKVTGAAADEFHRLMAGEGARLSSLIENVLDFARIEQGRKEYHMAETDIAALVQDAVKLMTPQAEARGLRIVCELEPLPFVPKVDAGALQQALINLLDNAIKFTPTNVARLSKVESAPDSTLECRATISLRLAAGADWVGRASGLPRSGILPERVGGRMPPTAGGTPALPNAWSLTVTDHGPGIPAAEHARIFERFYRLGNELRRETTGTGIGLAIVKHIVEGHGGRVVVVSELEKGSVFRMEFPNNQPTVTG